MIKRIRVIIDAKPLNIFPVLLIFCILSIDFLSIIHYLKILHEIIKTKTCGNSLNSAHNTIQTKQQIETIANTSGKRIQIEYAKTEMEIRHFYLTWTGLST